MDTVRILQIFKESTVLILCFSIGLYYWRHLNTFYRLILLQVFFAVLSLASARAVVHYQEYYRQPLNNHWVYNLYILMESIVLLAACLIWFESRKIRNAIIAAM